MNEIVLPPPMIHDARTFVVAVLWLHGRGTGEIAKVVTWTPGQVRGFVHRAFKTPRASQTTAERQAGLDELRAVRMDGGRLKDEHFIAIELVGKPPGEPTPITRLKRSWAAGMTIAHGIEDSNRQAVAIAAVNADHREKFQAMLRQQRKLKDKEPLVLTKEDRRDLRDIEADVGRRLRDELRRKAIESNGLATRRGALLSAQHEAQSSALDFLFHKRLLRDGKLVAGADRSKTSEEQRRLEAGMRLRAYLEGSRLGGLGAIDYERATMGSGGGPAIALSAYKLQCAHSVGAIRKLIADAEYSILEAVVDQDVFLWERERPNSKQRETIYRVIRYGLDIVGVFEGIMLPAEFKLRWDEELPKIQWPDHGDLARRSEEMAELVKHARRA